MIESGSDLKRPNYSFALDGEGLLGLVGEGKEQRGQNELAKSFHKSVVFIGQKGERIQIRLTSLKVH